MTHKEFENEQKRLSSTHNISRLHAECYMCNFEDEYICVKHNGDCKHIDICRSIYEKEK